MVGKKSRKRVMIIAVIMVLLVLICDMRLRTVTYIVESEKVNNPVKLVLITDLHSDRYGKEQRALIDAVAEQNPDVVLLGGDIFDDQGSYDNARITLKALSKRYLCYYVTGNHEYWSGDIETILDIVKSYDIPILSGGCDSVELNGETIQICGVDDPDVVGYISGAKGMMEQLREAEEAADSEHFTLLLSHRPEWVDTYKRYAFDLVLCGHAHGGQWRIPGILNGLYAPDQGLFPKYAGGRYDYGNGTMIVSRGLARESTPAPRIFNRPELVIVELK